MMEGNNWHNSTTKLSTLSNLGIYAFKGTVRLISSDPLRKDCNARFTTVPKERTLVWSQMWKIRVYFL